MTLTLTIQVHESIADKFLDKFIPAIDELKWGLPWEEGVTITPLPEPKKPRYLMDLIADSLVHGAKVVNAHLGGGEMHGDDAIIYFHRHYHHYHIIITIIANIIAIVIIFVFTIIIIINHIIAIIITIIIIITTVIIFFFTIIIIITIVIIFVFTIMFINSTLLSIL